MDKRVVFWTLGMLVAVANAVFAGDGLVEHSSNEAQLCVDAGIGAVCVSDKGTISLTGGEGIVVKVYANPSQSMIGGCGGLGGGLGGEVAGVGLKARSSAMECFDNRVGPNEQFSGGITAGLTGGNSTRKIWVENTHPPVQYTDMNGRFIQQDVHATTPLKIDSPTNYQRLLKIDKQDNAKQK